MDHLGQGEMRRILGGEGGHLEAEEAAEHLLSCDRCRAQAESVIEELRAARPDLRGAGSLQLVLDLVDREHRRGLESLAAIAEWTELRRLASRHSQRDRVRMSKPCHTLPFFRLVLDDLKEAPTWTEAEFLATLALLSIQAMSPRISPAFSNDLQTEVWTAVANTRRRGAEFAKAHQALAHAEKHRKDGTGDPRLEAGLLSITASVHADEGQVLKALDALKRCLQIYEELSDGPLLARTLVQKANFQESVDPAQGLVTLDQAAPLIPSEDTHLRLIAELLRVDCLIDIGRSGEALRVYLRCPGLLAANPRPRMQIRFRYMGARLMEVLGHKSQAERLLDEVVDKDIENDLYKDAFLDLLYLYGVHMKSGNLDKAERACRRALTDISLAAVMHDQMRDLWTQLLETTRHAAVSQDRLNGLRQYLEVHWRHPAAAPPTLSL